ncbi:MAG TPA: cytochrome c maturation protein CcmE [Terriglobia bacterium]|nr:cytochrome c maturation protein CcmE [Terriglobia bacterium]
MNKRMLKFGIGIGIVLAVVAYEAISGFQQNEVYYVSVNEILAGKSRHQRVRVGGVVAPGSIERQGDTLKFKLAQGAEALPVVYVGSDTLPDTFRDGSQAIVEGRYSNGGMFRATEVQAKCASKYQVAPAGPKTASRVAAGPMKGF